MEKVIINIKQIERLTEKLEDIRIKDSYRNREFITFNAKRNKKIIAYFFCSAICHQTYSLVNRDKNLIGWNYLEYVFLYIIIDIKHIN